MKYAQVIDYAPRVYAVAYATFIIGYWILYNQIYPYWLILLVMVGLLYAIKDYFLERQEKVKKEELNKFPDWVKNHAIYGIDGYAKVKRRILLESK